MLNEGDLSQLFVESDEILDIPSSCVSANDLSPLKCADRGLTTGVVNELVSRVELSRLQRAETNVVSSVVIDETRGMVVNERSVCELSNELLDDCFFCCR